MQKMPKENWGGYTNIRQHRLEDNGLLFWVPDVLCQHSEVVVWDLLAFKCSFDEFVGEKVFSPSYSSAILAPPSKELFH